MSRRVGVLVIGLVVVCCLSGVAVAQNQVEIEGIASPVAELQGGETGQFGQMISHLESAGYEVPPNVYILMTDEQNEEKRYIVFANTSGHPGILEVRGEDVSHIFPEEERGDDRVVIADGSELKRDGEPATRKEVNANIEQYRFQLVELELDYNQFAMQVGLGDAAPYNQGSVGQYQGSGSLTEGYSPVNASLMVMSTSMSEWEGSIVRPVRDGEELEPIHIGAGPNWWGTGPAKIDVIVTGEDEFLLTKHRPEPEREVTTDAIAEGEVEKGERVSVTTEVTGSAISIKESLLKVAQCAPDSVLAPVVQCMPLTTDATIHTGLMAGESSRVTYVGISNHRVNGLADPEYGEYRLVGEVVSANTLDVEVPGEYALRVEYMEKTGEADISNDLTESSGVLQDRFIRKMGTVAGKHGKYSEFADTENLSEDRFEDRGSGPDLEPTNTDSIQFDSIRYNPQYAENGEVTRAIVTVKNTGDKRAVERVTVSLGSMTKYDRKVELRPGETQQFTVERLVQNNRGVVFVNGDRVGQIGYPPDGWTETPTATIEENKTTSEDGSAISPPMLLFGLVAVLLARDRYGQA